MILLARPTPLQEEIELAIGAMYERIPGFSRGQMPS